MSQNRRGAVLNRHLTKNKTKLSNFNLYRIKNTKQLLKNNSGITMVSLVITIIVMVILASVSLNLITGGEGIFDKATNAVSEHKKGQEKDILNMAYSSLFLKSSLDDLEINEDVILNEIGQKNVGVVRDEDDEENYIITFTGSRNVYYMNFKTGTVEYTGTYEEETDKIEIKEQDVTFKLEPSEWTNGNVITTIKVSQKVDMTNYVLQWSKDARNWSTYIAGIVSTKNEIIYARIKYNLTGATKLECSTNVDKIDTKKPTVNVTSSTTNSITFNASDVADTAKGENASGVAGYMIIEGKTTPATPSATDTGWTAYYGSNITVSGLTQGKTYNVFVKDNAGNVSTAGSAETGNVVISKENISSTVTSWSGTTATVRFTTTTGYYIQTKVGNGSWSANPETTGSATTTATTGTTVYARLTDSSGQYNTGDFATETPILTYTVAYNGNGATSGSTASSSHNYGTDKNLTANGFSRTGYTFAGWNTSANGSGTAYNDGQSVMNLSSENGSTVTLYAQWEASNVVVKIMAGVQENITITRNGETYDTVKTDSNGEVVNVSLPVGELTLYGDVSKKVFTRSITKDTTEVKAMPNEAIYWYGNECNGIVICTSNGSAVKETNRICFTSSSSYGMCALYSAHNYILSDYTCVKGYAYGDVNTSWYDSYDSIRIGGYETNTLAGDGLVSSAGKGCGSVWGDSTIKSLRSFFYQPISGITDQCDYYYPASEGVAYYPLIQSRYFDKSYFYALWLE